MNDKDLYYLGNNEYPAIQLSISSKGVTITKELHWDSSGRDMCEAFFVLLSHFHDPLEVLKAMKAFGSKTLLFDDFYNCKSFLHQFDTVLTCKAGADRGNIEIQLNNRCTGIDLCRAFHTICMSLTYHPESIYVMMEELADEFLPTPQTEPTESDED